MSPGVQRGRTHKTLKHRNRGNITDLLVNETLSRVAGSHKDNNCATQHVAAQPAPHHRAAGHAVLQSSSAFAVPTGSCHRLSRGRLLATTPANSHRRHRGEQVERWRQRRALQDLRALVHAQPLWQAAQQRAAHEVAVQASLPQGLPPQLVVLHRGARLRAWGWLLAASWKHCCSPTTDDAGVGTLSSPPRRLYGLSS